MKSFITAIILLTTTAFLVVSNALYVDNSADALLKIAREMPTLETLQQNDLKDTGDDNTNSDESTTGSAEEKTEKSPSEDEIRAQGQKAISDFKELWEKKRHVLELFVAYENINSIQTALDQLTVFYEGEYYTDYGAQRNVLITAVKRLDEIEDFSLDSIM